MANVYIIRMSDKRTATVCVERHGLTDYRARVAMPHIGLLGPTLYEALRLASGVEDLHSMQTEAGALAEATLYVGSELSPGAFIVETLHEDEVPREALIAALRREGTPPERGSSPELHSARNALAAERARADELAASLERVRGELVFASKLCADLAKQRDEREGFITALNKASA